MRDDELRLDNCVKCSDCNTACPVSKVYPEYAGPKALGPDMERFRREGVASDSKWLEYCLGCHGCDLACPHGVKVSELIAKAKAQHQKSGRRSVRDHWLARPDLVGKMSCGAAPMSNSILGLKASRWMMSSLGQIAPQRPFPEYSSRPLGVADGTATDSPDVIFFPGCFIRYNSPELGRIAIDLLRRNGMSVEVSSARCCGLPAIANGDREETTHSMQATVAELVPEVDRGAVIMTACTSCGYSLKADSPEMLAGDPALSAAARRIANNTYDLGELLSGLLDDGKLNTDFQTKPCRLAYHAPCHLKSQGIGRPWLRLLREVPGIEIEEIKADCCGMAGTFGFKQEKYPISMDIGKTLFDGIRDYEPDLVVTECGTCKMQIEHGTHQKTVHPAEILYAAYGRSPGERVADGRVV